MYYQNISYKILHFFCNILDRNLDNTNFQRVTTMKKEQLKSVYLALRESGIVKNKKDFAETLELHYTSLSSAFSGKEAYLSSRMVDRIVARFPQVNRAYLSDGTLPVLLSDTPETCDVQVPLLPISAIAGRLSGYDVGVQLSECERIASPISGVDFAIEVTGESMSPDYPSGSRVFVKRIDMEAFIEWGRVYLLDTVNGSVLKIVQPSDTDERVRCVSCNPTFAPFDVRVRDIRAMYRVLLCMTLK